MGEASSTESRPSARELAEWQRWLADIDQAFFESVVPEGTGIGLGRFGYALSPRSVRDDDDYPICEPPPPELSYVLCRYALEGAEWPWAYLRYWSQYLRVGGRLILFAHDRHWEWADRYACWELDDILESLGFGPPFTRRGSAHGFGFALVAEKVRPVPVGVILHAAAAERDGKAALVYAPHGSGKTSLLLRLLNAGWRFIADSFILVDENLTGWPGMAVFSVRPGLERFVSHIGDIVRKHPAGLDATGRHSEREWVNPLDWKHRFRAQEVTGLAMGVPAPVDLVFMPEVAPDEPARADRLGRGEVGALLRANLLPYYGHNLHHERRRRQRTLDKLLEQATFIRVRLGRGDPVDSFRSLVSPTDSLPGR